MTRLTRLITCLLQAAIVMALGFALLSSWLGEELRVGLSTHLANAAAALPASADLLVPACLIAAGLALPVGRYIGTHPDAPLARFAMLKVLLGVALPVIFLGPVVAFAATYPSVDLPFSGRGEVLALFGNYTTGWLTADGLRHLAAPVAVLAFGVTPLLILRARDAVRANSHPEGAVVAEIGLCFVALAVIENAFQRPGIGAHLIDMAERGNSPALIVTFAVIALICILCSALAKPFSSWAGPTK